MRVYGFAVLVFAFGMLLIAGCAQQAQKGNQSQNATPPQAQPPAQAPPSQPPPAPPPSNGTGGQNLSGANDMWSDDLDQALSDLEAVR